MKINYNLNGVSLDSIFFPNDAYLKTYGQIKAALKYPVWYYDGAANATISQPGTATVPTFNRHVFSSRNMVKMNESNTWGYRLDASGDLWVWGANNFGQLGQGNTTASPIPVLVGTAGEWADVTLLSSNTIMAIKKDGSLWGWGFNQEGTIWGSTSASWSNLTSPTRMLPSTSVFKKFGQFSIIDTTDRVWYAHFDASSSTSVWPLIQSSISTAMIDVVELTTAETTTSAAQRRFVGLTTLNTLLLFAPDGSLSATLVPELEAKWIQIAGDQKGLSYNYFTALTDTGDAYFFSTQSIGAPTKLTGMVSVLSKMCYQGSTSAIYLIRPNRTTASKAGGVSTVVERNVNTTGRPVEIWISIAAVQTIEDGMDYNE